MEEVRKVAQQQYIDFSAMIQRHQKNPYSGKKDQPRSQAQADVPVTEWVRMFCAFQAEHLRIFHKDGPHMPKYVDRVIWMANMGMNWQHFDTTYRQKKAKRLQRQNRKVRSWAKNDIELYISCSIVISRDVPKDHGRFFQRRTANPNPATQIPSPSQRQMKEGTCWRFQYFKQCDGICAWPDMHHCYK